MLFRHLRPAVPKTWLVGVAGVMWSVVGLMLCRLAYHWLVAIRSLWAVGYGGAGIALGLIAYYFSFSRIVHKNIDRFSRLPERVCFFAFQEWKSYLIIGFMVTLGLLLRHSPLPKGYLAVIYVAVGSAMLLSSLHYYAYLRQILLRKPKS